MINLNFAQMVSNETSCEITNNTFIINNLWIFLIGLFLGGIIFAIYLTFRH